MVYACANRVYVCVNQPCGVFCHGALELVMFKLLLKLDMCRRKLRAAVHCLVCCFQWLGVINSDRFAVLPYCLVMRGFYGVLPSCTACFQMMVNGEVVDLGIARGYLLAIVLETL